MNIKKSLNGINWRTFLLIACLFLPLLTGCSKTKPDSIPSVCSGVSEPCLQGKAIVKLETIRGEITIELDGDASPITAGNFLDLARKGVYDNVLFHRVINLPVPFVVQGGDPLTKNPAIPKSMYGTGNYIDVKTGESRFIPLEIKLKDKEKPYYNMLITDPSDLAQIQLIHKKGSVAMARSQEVSSASSQFYISLRSLPELDGRYAVFGRVIKGMDIVEEIQQGDEIIEVKQLF